MNSSDRDLLGEAASRSPEVAKAVAGLSQKDIAKLREILADPQKTEKILSTPMAQQLLRQLSAKNGQNT